jgi:hypothetical protein
MKTYLFTYESNGNYFRGKISIPADNLVMAQDKFIDWLKRQDVYQHLWRLSFGAEEIITV